MTQDITQFRTTNYNPAKLFFPGSGKQKGYPVIVAPSVTFAAGTVLGRYTSGANAGLYGIYNKANTDGTERARGIAYAGCNTTSTADANGSGTGGKAMPGFDMYYRGDFDLSQLTGWDDKAAADLVAMVDTDINLVRMG